MDGKKFHFYVNVCPNCNRPTYISLRPHKQRLCRSCTKIYSDIKPDKLALPDTEMPPDDAEEISS